MLDLALASDLEARFRMPIANTDEAEVAELLRHPRTVLGLSDAGAHASQLCDACAPTHLLAHWVRETGVLSLEEGVRRLTSATAEDFGLRDRGRLAVGLPADVVVFDPDTVGCGPLRRVRDFPAGADRLVSDAIGIRAVIVEGTPIREDGRDVVDPEGPLPGHVLRGGRGIAAGKHELPDHLGRLAHHRARQHLSRPHRVALPRRLRRLLPPPRKALRRTSRRISSPSPLHPRNHRLGLPTHTH